MPFTEVLMDAGGWSLPLKPNLPAQIRRALELNDTDPNGYAILMVTREWSDPSQWGAYSSSTAAESPWHPDRCRYSGFYNAQEGNIISGPGLAWALGSDDGYGRHDTSVGFGAFNFEDTVDSILFDSPWLYGYNLILGPGGTIDWEYAAPTPNTREALDYVVRYFGAEWRMNTDMMLDIGEASDIYPADPTAMFSATGGGADPEIKAISARFEAVHSLDGFFSRAIVSASGGFPADAVRATPYTIRGHKLDGTTGLYWDRLVVDNSDTAADPTTQAQAYIDTDGGVRSTYRLICDSPDPADDAGGVGCDVFVYDLANNIYAVNEGRYFRGEWTLPDRRRLTYAATPFRRGMGITLRAWENLLDFTDTDLTPYVDWAQEPTAAVLEVGERLLADRWRKDRLRFQWQGR